MRRYSLIAPGGSPAHVHATGSRVLIHMHMLYDALRIVSVKMGFFKIQTLETPIVSVATA